MVLVPTESQGRRDETLDTGVDTSVPPCTTPRFRRDKNLQGAEETTGTTVLLGVLEPDGVRCREGAGRRVEVVTPQEETPGSWKGRGRLRTGRRRSGTPQGRVC